jgi:hypothetical protein
MSSEACYRVRQTLGYHILMGAAMQQIESQW